MTQLMLYLLIQIVTAEWGQALTVKWRYQVILYLLSLTRARH